MAKFRRIHYNDGNVRRETIINLDQIVSVDTPNVPPGSPKVLNVYMSDRRILGIIGDDIPAFQSLNRNFKPG